MEELTSAECRVLGALVEKALTTPQQYPLSEQALLTACNQTSNREPVTDYGVAEVRRALIGLRRAGLAREVHQAGARVEKHRHTLDEALDLSAGEVALLALLLLRGPQTPGELRSRAARLHEFASVAEVVDTLDALADREPPLIRRLERRPGQKEARYEHLLGEEELLEAPAERPLERPGGGRSGDGTPGGTDREVDRGTGVQGAQARRAPAAPPVAAGEAALQEELRTVRGELAALRDRVAALERRLGDG